ncbi:MAG: hypothetical protein AAF533_06340 [Acidobacteriota bacterium]
MTRRDLTLFGTALVLAVGTATAQVPLAEDSVYRFIDELKSTLPDADSDVFQSPGPAQLDAFVDCFESVLLDDRPTALACLPPLGFELRLLSDPSAGRDYLVVQEAPGDPRGRGVYIVDPDFRRHLAVVAPHPLHDTNTPEATITHFRDLGARVFMMAGTHRCSSADLSGCDGSTGACSPDSAPFRVSDLAHATEHYLQAAHLSLLRLDPVPVVFNFHGNSSEPVAAIVSDGTRDPASPLALVNRLRESLLHREVTTASCNWPPDDVFGVRFCGITNTQGRLMNSSPEHCTEGAGSASGRFIHLEQYRFLRDDPALMGTVLRETLRATEVDLRVRKQDGDVILEWTGSRAPYLVRSGSDPRLRVTPLEVTVPMGTLHLEALAGGTRFYLVD